MAEPELEEGEAWCHKDDTNIDPDIALSYIDEKLQNVLGHFQKDFEGGVCAENLGAKFGGYGSFLPMHQRFPSVRSHPKTPQRSQDNSTPKSPNNFHLEGVPQKSLVPSDVPLPPKHRTTSLGMHLLHDPKVASADSLVKTDSCLLPAEVGAKVPEKHEPSLTKYVNPTDQKNLRVRIKLGSDNAVQENAAIYIGLGLTSPSSSMGHSPKESDGVPFESQDTLDDFPASILQCMTSFPVTGSVLLSPLHGSLLRLIREENISLDSKSSIPIRGLQKDSTVLMDNSASMLGNGKVLKDKETKSVVKTKILEETKRGDGVHYKNNMTSLEEKTIEIEPPKRKQCFSIDLKLKLLSIPISDGDSLKDAGMTLEAHREADKDVPLKKRDVSKSWVQDRLMVTSLAKEEFVESIIGRDGAKHEQHGSRSRSIEKFREHGVRSSEKEISVDLSGGGVLSKPFGARTDNNNNLNGDFCKDGLLWFRDMVRYAGGELSMAVIQANMVLEDQSQIESGPFGTFVGVYDGHGGPETARYVCDHLFRNFQAISAENNGVVTPDTINRAFLETERGFTAHVTEMWNTRPNIATVGACCLVGIVYQQTLFVANLGDSRVVLGKKVGNTGVMAAIQLSTEHNANVEETRQELKKLHPDDPQIVVLKHGVWRVKGIIQVSRSLGDVYMKHAQFNREPINGKFRLPEPMNMPIMSATPSIISHPLQPNDSFLIFASDGLWEQLSNEKAVDIVHNNPRTGSAKRLVKAALKEAARKREMRYADLRKIDKRVRRHFHDDITVIVLFLNHDLISKGMAQDTPVSVRSALEH